VAKKKPTFPPTFEESLEQLEAIVRKLEGGQLPLADSLEQYELGIRHLGWCYKMLTQVEKKVELLRGLDSQGKPLTESFDDLEEEPEEGAEDSRAVEKEPSLAKKRVARSRRRSSPDGKKLPANRSPAHGDKPSNMDERGTLF